MFEKNILFYQYVLKQKPTKNLTLSGKKRDKWLVWPLPPNTPMNIGSLLPFRNCDFEILTQNWQSHHYALPSASWKCISKLHDCENSSKHILTEYTRFQTQRLQWWIHTKLVNWDKISHLSLFFLKFEFSVNISSLFYFYPYDISSQCR